MVCHRCKLIIKMEFEKLGIDLVSIELGEVTLENDLPEDKLRVIDEKLKELGFEILSDQKKKVIEKIKTIMIDLVYYEKYETNKTLSFILSKELNQDYSAISKLFSELEGVTIEKYLIKLKIERAKELLIYDELNLNEIAFKLNYSSSSHLSSQFKKITGLTPSFFKKLNKRNRNSIDDI